MTRERLEDMNSEQGLSRRKFLLGAAAAIILGETACTDPLTPSYDVAPDPSTFAELSRKIREAIKKAASVTIRVDPVKDSDYNPTARGGLFLFTNDHGDHMLAVGTDYHVASGVDSWNALSTPTGTKITIPNENNPIEIHGNLTWILSPKGELKTDYDGNHIGAVYFPLNEQTIGLENYSKLIKAIDAKEIVPLIPGAYDKLKPQDTLVMVDPSTGGEIVMSYTNYDPTQNTVDCSLDSGRVCEGFSGSPTLYAIEDNKGNIQWTNLCLGVLSLSLGDYSADDIEDAQCTTIGHSGISSGGPIEFSVVPQL